MRIRPADVLALLLSVAAFFASAYYADRTFEYLPHIEDEMAYVWQAQAITRGEISLPSPECERCFLVPFVVDYQGQRFGKYPLAWPVVLSFGIHLGVRPLVNPFLAGFAAWLVYRLGKKIAGEGVGLLAVVLTVTSPFFVMNSATLLSHAWGLFLTLALTAAWLDTFWEGGRDPRLPRFLPPLVAGLSLGLLALTRPLSAVGVAIPFGIHGLILLVKGTRQIRLRVIAIGLIALVLASLHFVWQYALTGDPLLNPYTLWWPYDQLGFGPGVGLHPDGHTIFHARSNTRFSLRTGNYDLFGWAGYSWIFLPFGMWALRKNLRAWLAGAVFPALVFVYLLYWIGSWLYGPRYYYEGLFGLVLFSAAGIAWLMGFGREAVDHLGRFRWRDRLRPMVLTTFVTLLICANLLYYLPQRMASLHGLYGVERKYLEPFRLPSSRSFVPALVIVHKQLRWIEYGTLLDLGSPFQDTPFVVVYDPTLEQEARLIQDFPGRKVFHYYRDTPNVLYTNRRP
jgi:hypothetical protein